MTYPADERAQIAYQSGVHPLDHAEAELTNLLDAISTTVAFTARNGFAPLPELSAPSVSRRVVGFFLGAGWTPPGGLEIPGTPEGLETDQ